MAVLVRTTQTEQFVHRTDPTADPSGTPAPDPQWMHADGQPPTATRFRVRPLNCDQWAEVLGMADAAARNAAAARHGLVDVDGTPVPLDELPSGWATEIANLVLAVTMRPFAGRLPTSGSSTGPSSPGTSDGEQSHGSR